MTSGFVDLDAAAATNEAIAHNHRISDSRRDSYDSYSRSTAARRQRQRCHNDCSRHGFSEHDTRAHTPHAREGLEPHQETNYQSRKINALNGHIFLEGCERCCRSDSPCIPAGMQMRIRSSTWQGHQPTFTNKDLLPQHTVHYCCPNSNYIWLARHFRNTGRLFHRNIL